MVNTRFRGHHVGNDVKKDSWKECQARCNKHTICFAWTYVTKNHRNFLWRRNCHMKGATFMLGKGEEKGNPWTPI